jgi:choline dehydrogenase
MGRSVATLLRGHGGPTPALEKPLAPAYDYIVVGAGSAGCVVASRLSEDPSCSVLLIEAGPSNQSVRVRSPMVTCPTLQNTELDWAYRTTPQPATEGKVSYWPRGKTLGGSSSINYMLYVRGDPRNYDRWARDLGCDGWSYAEVLPYFRKSENLLGADPSGAHGAGGPLDVDQMQRAEFGTKRTCEQFVASCVAAGMPANADVNGPSQTGAALSQVAVREAPSCYGHGVLVSTSSVWQVTVREGVRCDTASAFLFGAGALRRPNLTVATERHVTQVCLEHSTA